jgi:hypothetical protein
MPVTAASSVPLPVRYFDVVLILAALPLVALAGLPMLGYGVGAAAWIAQRFLGLWIDHRAASAEAMRTSAFIAMAGVITRAWLMGLTILAVGLAGEREDGLTAAIEVLVAFTVYLALSVILRPRGTDPS